MRKAVDSCVTSYTTYSDIMVKKGDAVYLRPSGSVRFGPWAGSGGPEGIEGSESYSVYRNFKHGALLGKISQYGNWFPILYEMLFAAEASGKLYVMINDADPTNNEGYFYIEYKVAPKK